MIYVTKVSHFPSSQLDPKLSKDGKNWCRLYSDKSLTSDNLKELHEFAERIGLPKKWFQKYDLKPHYLVVASMRKTVFEFGAVPEKE